jgi:hypothetical protein
MAEEKKNMSATFFISFHKVQQSKEELEQALSDKLGFAVDLSINTSEKDGLIWIFCITCAEDQRLKELQKYTSAAHVAAIECEYPFVPSYPFLSYDHPPRKTTAEVKGPFKNIDWH